MGELRLMILLFGAALVGAVWWWGSRRDAGPKHRPTARDLRAEPTLDDADVTVFDPEVTKPGAARGSSRTPPSTARATQAGEATAGAPPVDIATPPVARATPSAPFDPDQQLILSLAVLPAPGSHFLGSDVLEVMMETGLRFGERQVFHRLPGQSGPSLYSVANLVEPGAFEPAKMRTEYFPGLLFFAVLPGPRPGSDVFADMLATARRIAQRLHGEVTDGERSTLTPQTIQHLRERVVEFEHRVRSGGG